MADKSARPIYNRPITPSEAIKQAASFFPDGVFVAFNHMIVSHLRDGVATFKAKDAAAQVAYFCHVKTEEVYRKRWLDVEAAYRKAGWSVEYDRPGFNETYEATFTFKRRKR